MAHENIFQMYTRLGATGFFVKRNSWTHPRTVAKVVSIGGLTTEPLPGQPPYHSQPKLGSPKVVADISYQGAPPRREELTSPGTYAYAQIDPPDWWPRS